MPSAPTSAQYVDDPVLPAASVLTGPDAADVLRAAVTAAGGHLHDVRATQVSYRPRRELIVQYAATVQWPGAAPVLETMLAGTTRDGAPAGTLPVQADDVDGPITVGVWRWPFDPAMIGLAYAVDPDALARWHGRDDRPMLSLVSYRPCRRAVVRAAWDDDVVFVKVVAPERTDQLVARHERMLAAGLPAPRVRHADRVLGLVSLDALPGHDLRARLHAGSTAVPGGDDLVDLVERIATIDLGDDPAPGRPGLLLAAPRHAAMIRRVLPGTASVLNDLLDAIEAATADEAPRPLRTIHGDLHEAQLRVDDTGVVVGLLDLDDLAPGDPIDDLARSAAHLAALAVMTESSGAAPEMTAHLRAHATRVNREIAARLGDDDGFQPRFAAALIGLATVPFCMQTGSWRRETGDLLRLATDAISSSQPSSADDPQMRKYSVHVHETPIFGCEK